MEQYCIPVHEDTIRDHIFSFHGVRFDENEKNIGFLLKYLFTKVYSSDLNLANSTTKNSVSLFDYFLWTKSIKDV